MIYDEIGSISIYLAVFGLSDFLVEHYIMSDFLNVAYYSSLLIGGICILCLNHNKQKENVLVRNKSSQIFPI